MNTKIARAVLLALAVGTVAVGALDAQSAPRSTDSPAKEPAGAKDKDGYGIGEARRDFRQLGLKEDEVEKIVGLVEPGSRVLDLARAEIRESQARLARLMLEEKPDMALIQKTVRESLEAEYRIRMTQIERNLALRGLLGDRRWAALSRLSRAFIALGRKGDLRELAERAGDSEDLARLFEVLRSLQ